MLHTPTWDPVAADPRIVARHVGFLRNAVAIFPPSCYETLVQPLHLLHRRYVHVADPALLRTILVDRADEFERGRDQRRLLGRSHFSLLTASPAEWDVQHKLFTGIMSPRSLAEIEPHITDAAETIGRGADTILELYGHCFELMVRHLFPSTVDADGRFRSPALARHLHRHAEFLRNHAERPVWRQLLSRSRKNRVDHVTPAAAIIYELALLRAAQADQDDDDHDVAVRLVKARLFDRERAIRYIAGTIRAGQTGTLFSFTMSLLILGLNPGYQEELRAHYRATGSLDRMRQHNCEVLRCFSSASMLEREIPDWFRREDRRFAAARSIVVSPHVVHRHRALWPDPDRFDPARWARPTHDKHAFLPFGLGRRSCIGRAFTELVLDHGVQQIVNRFRVVAAAGDYKVRTQLMARIYPKPRIELVRLPAASVRPPDAGAAATRAA
jgi:cytochrome P450